MVGSSLLLCCVHAAVVPAVVNGDVTVKGDAAFVVAALDDARGVLLAWHLGLRVPSTIIVHDDVHAFVMATGQTTPSLRAWSTYDTVHLLPPETWTDPTSTTPRLAHELCHLALWQRVGRERAKNIPRFVGEGVCSVVAGQGEQRMPVDQVRAAASDDDARAIDFDDDAAFSYGYAHAVFQAFVDCGGDVLAVVDATAAGARVDVALGQAPRAFLEGHCPQVGER